jgi:hypothetical protein
MLAVLLCLLFLILLLSPFVSILFLVSSYFLFRREFESSKKTSELLVKNFAEMNYAILSERPLTFKEKYESNDAFQLSLGSYIGGVHIDKFRYKNKIKRHFIVRNEKNHDFELIVTIIQTWGDKIKYSIDSKSRIRD